MRIAILTLLFALLLLAPCWAQRRVKLKQADALKSGRKGDLQFDRLLGNVVFVQNKTTIYCDSAYFYKKQNSIEAFGHVRILEGDSVTVTASRLEYDGNDRKAKLRENVVFTKLATATLYTDYLDYHRPSNMALYFNGGRLVDSINVLTSRKGYYNVSSNMASFKKDVRVKNPDYTMLSDSLQYNSRTKVIYFRTLTTVIDKDSSTFVYDGGEYDTRTRRSDLESGIAETDEYKLSGNSYNLDNIRKIYRIRGNVVMTSKKENLIIYGQAADNYRAEGITKVYDNAYVAKVTEDNDTLFMRADTLVSIDSQDPAKKRLLAYHNVRIFKKDLQGLADSVEYRAADSIIYMYRNPVLWSDENQMTADSISMLIVNNTIDRIFMVNNAFVISQDTLLHFNQIKGRNMTAEFNGKNLNRVLVDGNAESLYFLFDEKDLSFTGMNKMICSNIIIRFKEGKVDNMSAYVRPEANFVPPHELTKNESQLKGFVWKEKERPTRKDVVISTPPGKSPVLK